MSHGYGVLLADYRSALDAIEVGRCSAVSGVENYYRAKHTSFSITFSESCQDQYTRVLSRFRAGKDRRGRVLTRGKTYSGKRSEVLPSNISSHLLSSSYLYYTLHIHILYTVHNVYAWEAPS